MANVYATKSGLWSDTTVWNTGALPESVDVVYTNTFTVTANTSTKVNTIRNSSASGILSGGSFVLSNGVSLSANVVGGIPTTLQVLPNASSTIIGNLSGGVRSGTVVSSLHAAAVGSNSNLNVFGNLRGTLGSNFALSANTSGTINIYGSVTGEPQPSTGNGSNACHGIQNDSSGIINIYGDCFGSIRSNGVRQNSGRLNVYGNLYGATNGTNDGSTGEGAAIYCVAGTTNIYGNVYSGTINLQNAGQALYITSTSNVLVSGSIFSNGIIHSIESPSTTTSPLSVYGNIINAPNGRQAIYAPRYQVFQSASATYTRQAVNGYDSYTDYWTSNATFSYPASSDVILNTVYSNNTLSGSMALPPASAVALGASVGTTSGTASLTLEGILNQPVAALNTSNSIGARLKNVATTQALSAVANSLNFNN